MPEPTQLSEFRRNAEWALVAAAAHELQLPAALDAGQSTATEVARTCRLSPRGTEVLLGALEGLGIVKRDGDSFQLTSEGRATLVDPTSGSYQGDALRHWYRSLRAWSQHLEEVARSGKPWRAPEAPGTEGTSDPEALARFMAAMDNKPPSQVETVVETCLARLPEAHSMLDLGGGPGTFARAFARRGVTSTLFDRPEVIEHVGREYGLAENPGVRLESGDFLRETPSGEFDIVLLANVTHIYDAQTNAELIGRMARAVRPGGVLAVMDFVRGRSEFAPLFAVTMLMNTEEGNTYSLEEYRHWLQAAELTEIRCSNIDADRQLVTGMRSTDG